MAFQVEKGRQYKKQEPEDSARILLCENHAYPAAV